MENSDQDTMACDFTNRPLIEQGPEAQDGEPTHIWKICGYTDGKKEKARRFQLVKPNRKEGGYDEEIEECDF